MYFYTLNKNIFEIGMINRIIIFLFIMYASVTIVNWKKFWCMRPQHLSFIKSCKSTLFIFLHIVSFYNIAFKTCNGVEYRIIHIIHRIMPYHVHNIFFNISYYIMHVSYHKHVKTCIISPNVLPQNIYHIINTSHHITCHNINISYHIIS